MGTGTKVVQIDPEETQTSKKFVKTKISAVLSGDACSYRVGRYSLDDKCEVCKQSAAGGGPEV